MSVKTELAEEVLACRLCLATDTKLYGIYEYHFDRIVTEITGLKLATWDGLPRYVCACCRSELLGTAEFRNRCVRADQLLQYLMHQHSITMDSIKTIDRVSNKLALNLSIHKIDQSPIEFTHDDSDKNDIFITENSTEKTDVDNKINDKNDHFDDEIDNDVYDEDDEPLAVVFNDISTIDDELVKDSNKDAIEAVEDVVEEKKPSKVLRKRKKVPISKVKVKQKVEEGKKERSKEKSQFKRKKKGFKRFFSCEEDYIKFENNYNISIVKVSEEEQRKDMEARKESANYARAHIRCDKCYKGFLSEATFENHQKVHDPSMGSNSCHLCSARFKHPTRLRRHMETHALKFICKLCPLVTRHRGMAMMHSDFHSGKTFECKYCGVTFKKKTTFNTHIRVQHPLENASGGTCDVCGETFIGKRGLQQHKTMAHRKLPIPELKCASCGVQFENLDAVVRHSGDDSVCDPKLRSCPQCGETFPKDSQLEAHLLNSHVQQFYKCDDCDKSFATKSSLGTHVDRVHLRIKPKKSGVYKYHMYQKKMQTKRVEEICEICGKGYPVQGTKGEKANTDTSTELNTFIENYINIISRHHSLNESSTWLKYHQRTHTGERPYKCPECPKSYMTPAALQSHSVSHTGVRRWQCSQCPKTFLHQSSIYKHKLVHTGEKPYECHICNKTFTQSGSLATHVKYVHMKLKPPPRRRRRDAAV